MAVYELIHKIEIDSIDVSKIVGINMSNNITNYTNTCNITLSKHLRYKNKRIFSTIDSFIFKPEQIVKVQLGYKFGNQEILHTYFEGFISNINLTGENVAIIECEDYTYWLKQTKFNVAERDISLKALGKSIVDEVNKVIPDGIDKISTNIDGIDLVLNKFKAEEATGVQVLELLQKYTLQSYFKDNVLVIGVNYSSQEINSEIGVSRNNFVFSEYNRDLLKKFNISPMPNLIIDKKNLKFQRARDVKINITAKIIDRDGKVVTKKYGDEGGETRTFYFYGVYNNAEIEALVENQVKRLKYTGFKSGSTFQVFGLSRSIDRKINNIRPLDAISFDGIGNVGFSNLSQSNDNREDVYEKSTYLVVGVNSTYDINGFRQNVELWNKISVDGDGDSIVSKIEKNLLKIEDEDSESLIEKEGKQQSD